MKQKKERKKNGVLSIWIAPGTCCSVTSQEKSCVISKDGSAENTVREPNSSKYKVNKPLVLKKNILKGKWLVTIIQTFLSYYASW